jgi:hypothetical protein
MGKFKDKQIVKAADIANIERFIDPDELDDAIASSVQAGITAALGSEGAITSAISSAITAGIGEGGAIETWADGRYEAKASNG